MNKFGFFIAFVAIILFHCLIMTIRDYKDVIENYAEAAGLNLANINGGGTNPTSGVETEETQKYPEFKDYDYKNPNFSAIEEDGYDISNDFDLLSEDLMKYVENQSEFEKTNLRLEPVATEQRTTALNPNVSIQPRILQEENNNACKTGVAADIAQKIGLNDNQMNRNNPRTSFYMLKPNDVANERQINGGYADPKTGLMPFDPEEISDYTILQ